MNDKTRSRKWLLTFNNPEKFGFSHDNIKAALSTIKNLDYWCMCDEVGKEGTYHTHLFIYRQDALRFETIKKKFPTAHIDYCRGTTQENRDYIRKEGKYKDTDKEETNLHNTFEEFGECPIEQQGKRNDLNALYTMIKDGLSNYEILESNPAYMLQLEKIENCRQVILAEEFKHRFRELEVEYWFGKTDTGKSRTIMEVKTFGDNGLIRCESVHDFLYGFHSPEEYVKEENYPEIPFQEVLDLDPDDKKKKGER